MPYGTIQADKIQGSINSFSPDSSFFRNRIINGAMMIDQRNAGASVTPTTNGTYTLDRWAADLSQASKYSVQQNASSVTPPAGFKNYLGITSTSAYTVGSAENFLIHQAIEGFNFADLDFGTANAKTITISFWVRSSLTGTFGGSLTNATVNRCYPFSFTISSANTWEQKSVTIAGDTTGTWVGATNGIGCYLFFNLGTGSSKSGTAGSWSSSELYAPTGAVSVVGTNGATFYITGVQLEVGSTATSFDYRPYGTELQLCQRYYETITLPAYRGIVCQARGANDTNGWVGFKVTKRTSATMSSSGTFGAWTANSSTNAATVSYNAPNTDGTGLDIATSGMAAGNASLLVGNTSATIIASAEL